MGKKLTLKELEAKRKALQKKVDYYSAKIDKIENESNKIGFRY